MVCVRLEFDFVVLLDPVNFLRLFYFISLRVFVSLNFSRFTILHFLLARGAVSPDSSIETSLKKISFCLFLSFLLTDISHRFIASLSELMCRVKGVRVHFLHIVIYCRFVKSACAPNTRNVSLREYNKVFGRAHKSGAHFRSPERFSSRLVKYPNVSLVLSHFETYTCTKWLHKLSSRVRNPLYTLNSPS